MAHNKNVKHCCKVFKKHIKDIGMPLEYFPVTREYGLEMPIEEYPVGQKSETIMKFSIAYEQMQYCSWCGAKLPKNLRDEYIDILQDEYDIKFPITHETEKKIPKEFKNDKWWKNRGL